MMFLNLNKRTVFDKPLLERQGLHDYLTLPLTNENIELLDGLKEAIDAVIKEIPYRGLLECDNKALLQLVDLIEKSKLDDFIPVDELK